MRERLRGGVSKEELKASQLGGCVCRRLVHRRDWFQETFHRGGADARSAVLRREPRRKRRRTRWNGVVEVIIEKSAPRSVSNLGSDERPMEEKAK